jgi:competence ComEA-like helix-hairpin-helix protein
LEIPNISKININNASFKEILRLPYIDYNLTQKIFNYRNENDQFIQIEDLKKIDSFPIEKFDRIALYLTAD